MIGQLRGVLLEKKPPMLLIDVGGVAYEVVAPMPTFYALAEMGETVRVFTHLSVREDAHVLYGFSELSQRALFRTLIKVNGVGPKLALTILSSIEPDQFIRCVQSDDTEALVRLPGIGKKTAERLLIELRDKVKEWEPSHTVTAVTSARACEEEAVHALIALGYKPVEASRMISRVAAEGASSEMLIRLALQSVVTA